MAGRGLLIIIQSLVGERSARRRTGNGLRRRRPVLDICSYLPSADGGDGRSPASMLEMGGNNIGEELTTSNVTWGWFEGGFDNGYVPGQGTPPSTQQICSPQNTNVRGKAVTAYIPPCGLLRSDRRAELAGQHHQPPAVAANLAVDGGHRHLG